MRTYRKPVATVSRGQALTAALWNDLAGAVNEGLGARDIESAYLPDEGDAAFSIVASETSRSSSTVRITNPEDEEQYVDVDRPSQIVLRGSNGVNLVLNFA